jgi:hypothetical protein
LQRKLRQTAGVLVANASLWLAACATYVSDDVGNPLAGGSGAGAGRGGDAGATAGGSAGATNGGHAGASGSATANGGVGAPPPGGGGGGAAGGTGGASGGGAGAGGKAGAGGTGGTGGGTSGAGGKAGAGGTGGGTSGAGGKAGAGGTGGGTSGAAGTGGGGTVNLITNAGFETNTAGWSVFGGSGTIATTTDQAHTGTRSLVITGRTQTYQGPQYGILSIVTPGTSYSISLWGRLAASNPTGSLIVTVHYTCSGGTSAGDHYFRWVETTAASSSSWTHLTGVRTFPTCDGGGTVGAASLYVESPSATLSYYIDDVVLAVD